MLLHQISIMHYAVLSRHKKSGCKQQANKQAYSTGKRRVASILLLPSSFLAQDKTTPKMQPLAVICYQLTANNRSLKTNHYSLATNH